jgi:hypothetical protein
VQFSHPAAFWLLALLPVPLLLTRRRTPSERHVVSNVFLWRAAIHRTSGSLALRPVRRSSLALVQMACIAAIVVALSGPVLTHQGGLTAMVFDISASMAALEDGQTRFDAARARARSIIGSLPRTSSVRLILAAASPRESGTWNVSDPRLASTLDGLTPTAGRADIEAAIDAAVGRGDVDNVIVFSDTARSAIETDKAGTPSVQWVHVGRGAENSAVARVVANRAALGGQGGDVLVVLKHYGKRPREADVEILADGQPVGRAHAHLEPDRTHTVKVALSDLRHIVTARLVEEDALPLDDVRSVSVPGVTRTRVALFGRGDSFLARALAANPSVLLRTYSNDADASETAAVLSRDGADIVVCDGCTGPMPYQIPILQVANGYGQKVLGPVTAASVTHPLLASVEPGAQRAAVSEPTTASPGAEVLLRVGGVPAVVAAETDGRRSVDVFLDLSQPDFALTPAFPILVANAVEWLSSPEGVPADATAGEPLTFSTRTSRAQVHVTGPDGRPRSVQRAGSQVIVTATDIAGPYRIDVNGSQHIVVVNPTIDDESNLYASEESSAMESVFTPRVTASGLVPIAQLMVLLALALLGFEWRLRMRGAA